MYTNISWTPIQLPKSNLFCSPPHSSLVGPVLQLLQFEPPTRPLMDNVFPLRLADLDAVSKS